mgnify:CR=1 FL=1
MYRLGWWVLGLTLVLALCFSRMEGVPSGATTPFLFTGLLALGLAEYHHRRAQGSHYDQAAAAVPPLKGDQCPLCQRPVPAGQPPRCEHCDVLIVTDRADAHQQAGQVVVTDLERAEEALQALVVRVHLGLATEAGGQLGEVDATHLEQRQQELGKTVGDDFREGKITLPVVLSYRRGNDSEGRSVPRNTRPRRPQSPHHRRSSPPLAAARDLHHARHRHRNDQRLTDRTRTNGRLRSSLKISVFRSIASQEVFRCPQQSRT